MLSLNFAVIAKKSDARNPRAWHSAVDAALQHRQRPALSLGQAAVKIWVNVIYSS